MVNLYHEDWGSVTEQSALLSTKGAMYNVKRDVPDPFNEDDLTL